MHNTKKVAIALLVGAMAIGFSAFKNAPKKSMNTTARYYSTSGIVGDLNPAHFVYDGGATDDCVSNPSDECTAEWSTTNAPVLGETPTQAGSPSYIGNPSSGDYVPD